MLYKEIKLTIRTELSNRNLPLTVALAVGKGVSLSKTYTNIYIYRCYIIFFVRTRKRMDTKPPHNLAGKVEGGKKVNAHFSSLYNIFFSDSVTC